LALKTRRRDHSGSTARSVAPPVDPVERDSTLFARRYFPPSLPDEKQMLDTGPLAKYKQRSTGLDPALAVCPAQPPVSRGNRPMSPEELSDGELIARGKAGDADATAAIYRRYRVRIFGFLLHLAGDRDLAEDILCETFARFLQHLHRYQPEGSLLAYLMTIARTKLIDELRLRGRWNQPLPSDDEPGRALLSAAAAPEEVASTAEMSDLAQRALSRLTPQLREVVILRLNEGFDYAAIGAMVGAGEATVRSRMRYALEALREMMKASKE
jgi:RNA polymerase sigma-70 factor (ECF subfamily)